MKQRMNSSDSMELATGIMGLRKVFFEMDKENGHVTREDLHRSIGQFDIPEQYLKEATNIVADYNNKIHKLALKVILDNA